MLLVRVGQMALRLFLERLLLGLVILDARFLAPIEFLTGVGVVLFVPRCWLFHLPVTQWATYPTDSHYSPLLVRGVEEYPCTSSPPLATLSIRFPKNVV